MITTAQMYWLVTLDGIIGIWIALAAICFIAAIGTTGLLCETGKYMWAPIISLAISVIFMVLAGLTPSTKQMAAIIVVPKIVNNEKIKTVGNGIYDLAIEWIDELKQNKQKQDNKKDN